MVSTDERRERLEADYTAHRIFELRLDPVRGSFDAAHLREVNRRIFQDLPGYGFKDVTPGEYRQPSPPGGDWTKHRQLESQGMVLAVAYSTMDGNAIARLETALERANPAELSKLRTAEFTEAMGKLYAELDYVHPFSDGNSRTLRAFTKQLAEESGYNLDWERFNGNKFGRDILYIARDRSVNALALENIRHRDTLRDVTASLNASGQSRDLPDLLRDAVRPTRAIAFERLAEADALNAHPELEAAYKTLDAAKAHFSVEFHGNAAAYEKVIAGATKHIQGLLNEGETQSFRRKADKTHSAASEVPPVAVRGGPER